MYAASGGNGMAISMSMMQARNDRRGKRAELPDDIARKLKSCSVLNCEDWRDLSSYTTYHCFPTGEKNQDRWEIWTQLLRKSREDESWIPFRGSLVCSHHFRPEDFINEPLSKRRKLIKNAIPSIFPTFTVDLEDPSYQLPEDDEGEAEGNGNSESEEFIYGNPASVSFLDLTGENGYEYEYSTEGGDSQDISTLEQEFVHNDIQVTKDVSQAPSMRIAGASKATFQRNQTSTSSNTRPTPAIATSVGALQVRSTSSLVLNQQQQKPNKQAKVQYLQIPPNQVIHINGNGATLQKNSHSGANERRLQQRQMTSIATPQRGILPKRIDRKQEAMKALSSLPISLNPDLEIEMVDPEEDVNAYRNRITELEQQNIDITNMYENALETLKQKYESQLVFLRKTLREKERLLSLNSVSVSHNSISVKKARLS